MTRLVAAIVTVMLATTIVTAAPRRVLVLRADGAVDEPTRARVDAGVLALARNVDGEVTQGDITFADATATVGCAGDASVCGDQVLDALAVDEIVVVAVGPDTDGIKVSVARISKTSLRQASVVVPASDPDPALATGLGSLFGVATATPPGSGEVAPIPPPAAAVDPGTTAAPEVTAAPANVIMPEGRRTSRLAIVGLAGGGGLIIVGLLLWNAASDKASEIADAPTRTRADLIRLQALESDADAYALWGNVTVIGGVALAGVGGYLLWRGRRAPASSQARIVPLLFDHGAGLAVTIGEAP